MSLRAARSFALVVGLLTAVAGTRPALAEPCELGTLKEACASPQPERTALCKLMWQSKDDDDFAFVHLGGSFYVVEGTRLSLVNTETGDRAGISWRVDPVLAGAKRVANGRCLIADYRSSVAHGNFSDVGTLVMVRPNPISGTPYLVDVGLGALPLQEARSLMCSDPRRQKAIRLCSTPRRFDKAWNASPHPYTSAEELLKANRTALAPAGKEGSPYRFYEKAGILSILDEKPADLRAGQYVSMLNNYAVLASQTERAELAVELLHKVLQLAPERVPAYRNLADAIDAMLANRDEAMPLAQASLSKLRSASASYRKQHEERQQTPSVATVVPPPQIDALTAQFRQKAAPRLAQIKRHIDQTQKQLDARTGDADAVVTAFAQEHDKDVQLLGQLLDGERAGWPTLDGAAWEALTAALAKTLEGYGADVVQGERWPEVRGAVHALMLRRLGRWLTPAMKDFAVRMANEERREYVVDAELTISWDELAERAIAWERFLAAHPDFVRNAEVKAMHARYQAAYVVGSANSPPFDGETGELRPEVKQSYEAFAAKHKGSATGALLGDYLTVLKRNQWKRGPAVERFLRERKLLE